MKRRNSALDKFLGRLDDLDTPNLTNLVQRLARERRLLETVFNTIQDGILVLDERGIIQYANATAIRLIGIGDNHVGSVAFWKLMPDLAQVLDRIFAEEGAFERVVTQELELTYPERRFVRFYMVPLEEPVSSGQDRGYVMVISDITEEKTSTEELIENERVASIMNLAAGVAHELGNPLNSLNIHLQLMDRQLKKMEASGDQERLGKQLSICRNEVERLDGIIENFLEAVRPQPPDMSGEVDLQEALAEVLRVQEGELSGKGVEVDVTVTPGLPLIMGDRNQIKQVLFNIIKNGMEAVSRNGRIEILTEADDDYVNIAIRDNGEGISPEVLSRVFTPYFTTKHTGHGLGMMIVQRIIRDHGGQIGINSKVGKGTTVSLRFPRKDRRSRLLESGAEA